MVTTQPGLAVALQDIAQQRRGYGHHRHVGIAYSPLASQTEDEHAQDGTVGVGGKAIYGIDSAVVIQLVEHHNGDDHQERHDEVNQLSGQRKVSFILPLVSAEDVDGERGGQCG